MRRKRLILVLLSVLLATNSCTNKSTYVSVVREPLTEEEKTEYREKLKEEQKIINYQQSTKDVLYSEVGININEDGLLKVETWKLQELAKSYELQNCLDYIDRTEELEKQEEDWMHTRVMTKDFVCDIRLYGDDETMTLDIELDKESSGKYILAPQSTIINGVIKVKDLFRVTEVDVGHFMIKANMQDFDVLDMFDITMENIASIAWYLTAIDTETKEMNSFLLASAFPDDETWEGIKVKGKFSASEGMVMWVQSRANYTYLCIFNGSDTEVDSAIKVSAIEGDLISNDFHLNACSGEFSYIQLGFNLKGVEVRLKDAVIFTEK